MKSAIFTQSPPLPEVVRGKSVLRQVHPAPVICVPNFLDEMVDGHIGPAPCLPGNAEYKLRPMAMLGHGDAIVLPAQLVPAAIELAEHHESVGIESVLPQNIIGVQTQVGELLTGAIERQTDQLLSHASSRAALFNFIQHERTDRIAGILGLKVDCSSTAADRINNKIHFLEGLSQVPGVNVPNGITFRSEEEARQAFSTLWSTGKSVWGKIARAVSGFGVDQIETLADFNEFLQKDVVREQMNDPSLGARIDEDLWVPGTKFPNVLIWVGQSPAGDRFLNASYQILAKKDPSDERKTVHNGNVGPLTPEDRALINPVLPRIAEFIRSQGAAGYAGIDFVLRPKGSPGERIWVLECNFRVNGNSTPATVATEINAPFFGAHNASKVPKTITLPEIIANFRSRNLLWSLKEDQEEGLMIANHATAEHGGKIQIGSFAKTRARARKLLELAEIS